MNTVMTVSDDEGPQQMELPNSPADEAAKLEERRESLLRAVNSCQLNTMEERVAWLLNNFPKTRDSDITLQIRFWQNFESDRFEGGDISVSDYYRLAKLTSLTRARATIQNKLKLFQASEEVKKRRKQLEEGERANALKQRPNCHKYTIYVDESGKTQDNLIVGSMWYLNGAETLKIYKLVESWKKDHGINDELHFKSITEAKLPHYLELADLIAASSAMLSFKVVSVPRRACVETKYLRTIISLDRLWRFIKALYEYQREGNHLNKLLFRQELTKLQESLKPTAINIVETIANNHISELVFVPDHWTEALPILPAIFTNEQLRLRIKASEFVFRNCPALREEPNKAAVAGPTLCIINSQEQLEMAESEKALVKAFAPQNFCELDLAVSNIDFSKSPASTANHLHLATHNKAANLFTDPFFVSTSFDMTKNSIGLEAIQRSAHKLQLKLGVLNGCNTGTTGNRNYFKQFSTNEKIGLVSAFLLNRQCAIVATQWNEPEIVGYTFSSLFYKRLATQPDPAKSFVLTLVDLFELTKEGAIKLCEGIADEKLRANRCSMLANSKMNFPFRDAFCLGLFQFHSLLVK